MNPLAVKQATMAYAVSMSLVVGLLIVYFGLVMMGVR